MSGGQPANETEHAQSEGGGQETRKDETALYQAGQLVEYLGKHDLWLNVVGVQIWILAGWPGRKLDLVPDTTK